jgi:hypothetical protein
MEIEIWLWYFRRRRITARLAGKPELQLLAKERNCSDDAYDFQDTVAFICGYLESKGMTTMWQGRNNFDVQLIALGGGEEHPEVSCVDYAVGTRL